MAVQTGLTLLVDSASLIYRALFSVPDTIRAPAGTQVNAGSGPSEGKIGPQ